MDRPQKRGQRRRRWMFATCLLISGMLLFSLSGCKHRRSSLRPIYAAPAPTVVIPADPCPSGDCPPTDSYAPGFDDGSLAPLPAPSNLAPYSSPVSPAPAGEPSLDPDVLPQLDDLTPTSTRPNPEPPRETRGAGAARRAALRTSVQGLTNNPNDLFEPPRADRPWRYIVIHHSDSPSGSYAEIDQVHRERLGTAGCGYHFVIGNGSSSPDGQIEVTQRWADQKAGAHCRDARSPSVNDYGIGICLVGDLDEGPPTDRQVEAARSLVAYLQDRYAIADDRVASHAQVAASPTVCPGRHFPATAILGRRSLAAR